MESTEDISDTDIITFVQNILHSRVMPINYKNLRDLINHGPSNISNYAESKYNDENFLNFLLANSNLFNVSTDGSVVLSNGIEFVFPHSIDTVDSIAGVSDDSYFGDKEEYISDTDEDGSNLSLLSNNQLPDVTASNFDKMQSSTDSVSVPSPMYCLEGFGKLNQYDSTSTSDSTPLYLSTDYSSRDSTDSSFESCGGIEINYREASNGISSTSSSSVSYSSCSDS